ncbi:MAG: hypothetical protein AAB217_00175 [Chloroflexota bacterium]
MPKPRTRSGGPKRSPPPDDTKPKPKPKTRPRKRPRNLQFEATVQDEHLRLQVTAPTRWIYVVVVFLGCAFFTAVALLFPEWWPAIQTAIALMTKLLAAWK